MVSISVYDHIKSNNFKTLLLVCLFPISFIVLFFGLFYIAILLQNSNELMNFGLSLYTNHFYLDQNVTLNYLKFIAALGYTYSITIPIFITSLSWLVISYFFGDNMMLSFAEATEIPKNNIEYSKIYQIIGDVAIKSGLPTPKAYLIDDDSLNAFATGRTPKTSSIALSKGLIKKLNNLELEGVIAHEMAHIGNRDIRLNMLIITGIGVFGFLADILSRQFFYSFGRINTRSSNDSKSSANLLTLILILTWIALLIFNLIVAPLIKLAISRTREYNADAAGALITRNPGALASALEKINIDSKIEILDKKRSMEIACIADPTAEKIYHKSNLNLGSIISNKPLNNKLEDKDKDLNIASSQTNYFSNLFSTHPSIESRIERLRKM